MLLNNRCEWKCWGQHTKKDPGIMMFIIFEKYWALAFLTASWYLSKRSFRLWNEICNFSHLHLRSALLHALLIALVLLLLSHGEAKGLRLDRLGEGGETACWPLFLWPLATTSFQIGRELGVKQEKGWGSQWTVSNMVHSFLWFNKFIADIFWAWAEAVSSKSESMDILLDCTPPFYNLSS